MSNFPNNDFEDQLRGALRRPEPPAGLADRIIERTRALSPELVAIPATRPRWRPVWSIAAIAAMMTLVTFSISTYQHAREEQAARQAVIALRIASEKLNVALKSIEKRD